MYAAVSTAQRIVNSKQAKLYGLKRVAKTKPIKQIPETEAIFKGVNRINQQADDESTTLTISIDAKVGIKIGEFDRGVKTRAETILRFASTLTFKGENPMVTLVETIYHTGVKLTQQAMADIEEQIHCLPTLKKWFVEIFCRGD